MHSDEAVLHTPQEVDFVFIDGNHHYSYVKKDIPCYWPKVKAGGWLTGHDYHDRCPVPKAVDQFVAAKGLKLKLLPLECWADPKNLQLRKQVILLVAAIVIEPHQLVVTIDPKVRAPTWGP